MNNNTIFDDVFRTMVEKMTYLLVPLINEVFHTSYPKDVKIVHLRNEHQLEDGELITDAQLLIGDKVYHIECQSTDDITMAIRMFEYDFAIALESRRRVGRKFYVEFPRSCVIYLRSTKNTPDVEEVELLLPDGQVCVYRVPTVKVDDCVKFVEREIRRGNHYDAIIMDPPSYGRGPKGEIWKIEDAIHPLIKLCTKILSDDPLFFLVNSYTTGLAPAVLTYMLATELKPWKGNVESQEIGLPVTESGLVLPCGASGRWSSSR